jgi:hypothetical protein
MIKFQTRNGEPLAEMTAEQPRRPSRRTRLTTAHDKPNLTDKEIKEVIDYVKTTPHLKHLLSN